MFSPATKKTYFQSQKHNTPVSAKQSVPNRPSTGTPAPRSSRLSVLNRVPAVKTTKKSAFGDAEPLQIGEFPSAVRNAQINNLHRSTQGLIGGIDRGSSLSWMICGNQLFIWPYLSTVVPRKCVTLQLPSFDYKVDAEVAGESEYDGSWMICIIKWETDVNTDPLSGMSNSVGVVACNGKSHALVYWPNIYSESGDLPIVSQLSLESNETAFQNDAQSTSKGQLFHSNSAKIFFTSLIASAIQGKTQQCIALACSSTGDLIHFHCSPTSVHWEKIPILDCDRTCYDGEKRCRRKLIWRHHLVSHKESNREFFLLTGNEIQCWNISLATEKNVMKLWSHDVIGNSEDMDIKKDDSSEKKFWLLDMQVDDKGRELTVLVASFNQDTVISSIYTQYSLLTLEYRSKINIKGSESLGKKVLEETAPMKVLIPNARLEDETFLLSMKLRMGGRSSGSVLILSGDGTITVTNYWNSAHLYQFGLPRDTGKVLDASACLSSDNAEESAWIVLTERAGIWAIPEKAIILEGSEPLDQRLPYKVLHNGDAVEIKRNSDNCQAQDGGYRKRTSTDFTHQLAQDEESESLLGQFFHDFLLSDKVEECFEKLKNSEAFERDGEGNIFARTNKSIVDTLAKHWTTTRGSEIIAMSVISYQLLDKQHKHQRFLQFLALSKCLQELSSRQRLSLQIIMEHGEKLAAMIQLRELQKNLNENQGGTSPNLSSDGTGSLWDLIQLVGEKARRDIVLLMDRDNAEVFYRKVSDIEEVFYCLSHDLRYILGGDPPFNVQIQRVCELSKVCTTIIHAAMLYRNKNSPWYPSPEGLTPWYCQPVVQTGLWSVASLILHLSKETISFDSSAKSVLFSHLREITEVLLETYACSIIAKIERGDEHKSLVDEYWKRRDELLGSLYTHAKYFVNIRDQNNKITEAIESRDFPEEFSSLLTIARKHEGYETMWNICFDLNDTMLLRNLMHEILGPKGGFCYFVFQKMYQNHQYAKLLRLGEEFQEVLLTFLKEHNNLLWLHEVFLNHFSSASNTLHVLALTQDSKGKGTNVGHTESQYSLADRRRFLNLSKIAAVSGRDADCKMKLMRVDADLQILQLQEEILRLLPNNDEEQADRLLPPVELIEKCLKSNIRDLSLYPFDIFAWTSSSFRRSNKTLLAECWRNAANQDDWSALYQASITQGWNYEEMVQFLRNTILFQASNRCYGPELRTYDGDFEEVLPLQNEDSEFHVLKDQCSSVEVILMQHKDFPDVGKLMLTAIMIGKTKINLEIDDCSME